MDKINAVNELPKVASLSGKLATEQFSELCAMLNLTPTNVGSASDLEAAVSKLQTSVDPRTDGEKPRWIFRAEKFGENLTTTLERAVRDNHGNLNRIVGVENRLKREFRRRAHHYITDLPQEADTLQWLALMQHFGAPTRLMDWTYSYYVALFFALSRKASASSGYVIWAIEAEWLRKAANDVLKEPGSKDLVAQFRDDHCTRFDSVFRPEGSPADTLEPLVYPVNPLRLNERLTIQQGLFLSPRNLALGFVANLKALNPDGNCMKAFVVSPDGRIEMLAALDRMNMSSATLFPGLQGFAESLNTKPICYFPLNASYDDIR